jgi:hypothetical protein
MLQLLLSISIYHKDRRICLTTVCVLLTGANLKLESGSEGKPEANPHVSSESKMPESSTANSSSNSSGVSASTKPVAVGGTQQADMKLPTEAGKEENATPTPE